MQFREAWMNPVDPTAVDEYQFKEERVYESHADPFEAGMQFLQRGNLSEAILAFEENVKRNPDQSHSWMWLGLAQAENDDDVAALTCLRKAVECDETDLDAYMALATSATNELTRSEALNALIQWLKHNPTYAALATSLPNSIDTNQHIPSDSPLQKDVVRVFLQAARSTAATPDADVQIALGLLFNMSHEYDKAVDCFQSATLVRNDDYLLWNKLGATLANSSRSSEALGAYNRALDLKPSYVRANINLGIALLNLERYPESASQFLRVQQHLQSGSGNSMRTQEGVWNKLKTVFLAMERYELLELCNSRNVDLFRPHFSF
jgi:peroxin-5